MPKLPKMSKVTTAPIEGGKLRPLNRIRPSERTMGLPMNPPSNLAIGGIYMFDEDFWSLLDAGVEKYGASFSITDVNRAYVQRGAAKLITLGEETWVDCGTPDSLLQAGTMAKEGKLNPRPFRT